MLLPGLTAGALDTSVPGLSVYVFASAKARRPVAIANSLVNSTANSLPIPGVASSFPEAFTSMVAARRRNVEIAVGSVVGASVFGIFLVLYVSCIAFSIARP